MRDVATAAQVDFDMRPSASLYLSVGLVAGAIFKQVWKRASPGDKPDPPTALQTEYPFKEILVAAAVQGVIYSVVKTVIDRQGARAFERWTGEWPGS